MKSGNRAAWVFAIGISLAVLLFLDWTASYTSPMLPQASNQWSRGRILGLTPVGRPVAMESIPGKGILLVWPDLDGHLALTRVGLEGEVLTDVILSLPTTSPRDPRIHLLSNGQLHLLWREKDEDSATIRYSLLESDGTPVGQLQVLSSHTGWALQAPQSTLDSRERLHVVWASEVGIEWVMISSAGALLAGPTVLLTEGTQPTIRADSSGQLHVAWQASLSSNTCGIYYGLLDADSGQMETLVELNQVFRRRGRRVEGPILALGSETGYVLWITDRGGESQYAFFQLDSPQQAGIATLRLQRGLSPREMTALDGQHTPAIVALAELTALPDEDQQLQVVVWALEPSQTPEEVVTGSHQPSIDPTLDIDDQVNLHLAWLEVGEADQYRVVYASTSADVRQVYNSITFWDIVDSILTRLFRLPLIVVALVPMLLYWAVAPFGGIIVYHFITGEEWLETTLSQVVLGVAVTLEVALTLLHPPDIEIEGLVLTRIAPVITALLASLVTVRFLRRRADQSLFACFFMFTGIHVLLLLAAYVMFW